MKNEIPKKYKCLILEDEPLASEILEMYVAKDAELEVIATCTNAVNASEVLKANAIDLLFLDLHLPIIKGFNFLRKLSQPPFVIVTTAYHEFALEGYELDVVDYLLKPIPYPRFEKAIQKFKHLVRTSEAYVERLNLEYITVTIQRVSSKIYLKDILFIESFREYILIHTSKEDYRVKMPISKMETLLPSSNFKRVHKSYIVALDRVSRFTTNELEINDTKIPIGKSFRLEY